MNMDTSPPKGLLMLGLLIGSLIGGYVPSIFGASLLSLWGLVGSTVGAILGLWIAYRITTE
jgi:uncharacterized membrane protein YeaQ/YmgE (transglycosylase-associated protein family)